MPHPSMSVDTVTDKCLSQAHPSTNTSHLTELISCYHKEPSHLATCTRTVGESTPALNTDSSSTYNYQSSAQGNAETTLRCTLNQKRTERCSPFPSPQKLPQSPARKQRKRPPPRTGTEQSTHTPLAEPQSVSNYHFINTCSEEIPADKTLSDFLPNEKETTALNELQEQIHAYMLQKVAIGSMNPQETFINIQDYLSLARANHTEKSNVLYLDVMDAKSDSKDTLMSMLQNLHQQFISRQGRQHLVVEGDAKIYELLQSLKFEYGDELQWLIPFPGDWHLLMNYQSALMKPYFDAGLKSLAEASGYPVVAIRNCTQFKRTHFFILKSWKAMYRAMLSTFINISSKDQSKTESIVSPKNLREQAIKALNEVNERTPVEFRKRLNAKVADITSSISLFYQQFKEFIQTMACRDETWRFWIQYVFVDAMAYVSLFFATRSGDWHLRMSSVKSTAAVFTAFDHPTYQKLISNHLSDLLSLPRSVLPIFEQGAFVVNTTGRSWHSVGIDEAHEMLINKQCKMSITKPSPDYINRIASYLTYRTKTLQQVKQQVFPETKKKSNEPQSVFSSKDCDKKSKWNVNAQLRAITASSLFETSEQQ